MTPIQTTQYQEPPTQNEFDKLLQRDFSPRQPDIVFDDNAFARVERIAKLMAAGHSTVPAHLRNNVTDCFAIAMQASAWGMNAFVVAQKTHVINGILGYEAQLVNAVVSSCGAIDGRFHYEYRGEGNSLECRVGATIAGESEITWGEWLSIASVTTKNSPVWKTNPKQQMGYLQVKNWARAYVPGALMGVYSDDELITDSAPRDIDRIKRVDLDSKPEEADAVIQKIDACESIQELELLRSSVMVLKGEPHKIARSAYTAAKKRLTASADPEKTKQAPPADPAHAVTDIAEVMAAISMIIDNDSKKAAKAMIDQLPDGQKAEAEAAYRERITSLKAKSKPEPEPKPAYSVGELSDFESQIDACADLDEFESVLISIPESAAAVLQSQIEKKRLQLDSADPFAVE